MRTRGRKRAERRARVVARDLLDDVLQAAQVLDGFGERVEASGAMRVQVDVLRALLHRVPGRSSLLI